MAKLSSAELAKREDVIQKMKKNKRSLVKRYGPDAEKVMYGRATNIAKKVAESEMEKSNLKELVRAALMQEKKKPFPDLTGDGKVTQADILKGRGIELDEYETRSVGPMLKSNEFKIGDKVKYKGMNHEITRIIDDRIYIKNLKYSGRPDTWVKDIDLKKSVKEDLDLGHEDNEPHMIKGDLYRIGKYAMELYQMIDGFEGKGEVDFPAWWQAKITKAKDMIVGAKHYLDFETKEPEIDAMVGVASDEEVLDNEAPLMEDEVTKTDKLAAKIAKALKNPENKSAEDQNNIKQARKAMNKGDIKAAEKIVKPYN